MVPELVPVKFGTKKLLEPVRKKILYQKYIPVPEKNQLTGGRTCGSYHGPSVILREAFGGGDMLGFVGHFGCRDILEWV